MTLAIYDLLGRIVSVPLNRTFEEAGPHDVPIQTAGWKPGVYFYRLEAGNRTATQKMVVVQ